MKLVGREVVTGANAQFVLGHQVSRGKASRNWSIQYTWRGRQRTQSLKTRIKRLAMQRLHEIDRQLGDGDPDRPNGEATIADIIDTYMHMLRARGRAVTTIRKYDQIGKTLIAWANEECITRAIDFHEPEFWRFAKMLADMGNTERTRYTKLIFLKQIWKHAQKVKLIPTNELAGIHVDKPVPEQQPCFTPGQVVAILNQADPFHRQVFSFLAYAGLRFGELRDLTWSQIKLDHGTQGVIELRRGGSGDRTKGRRLRRIHIHPKLREVIDQIPSSGPGDRVFEAPASTRYPEGGGPLKERRLLNTLKRVCRECGFKNPEQYCLHTFRHGFASMCAMANLSHKYALAWMGHRSSDVLDMYIEMYDSVAEEAIAGLDYEMAASNERPEEVTRRSTPSDNVRGKRRQKRRSRSPANKPARRWKVTSRKRNADDS